MKFEYKSEKYSDLGLIVKHGNIQNVVFFWDENEEAASYNVEIYRIDWQYKKEGFFEEAKILEREVKISEYTGTRREIDKYLSTEMPAFIAKQFVSVREWEQYRGTHRSEVLFYEFTDAKSVCTINIERNKYYHSINDLPCGNYIVCLKIEDRQGNIIKEAVPYYFHIDDAEKNADKRAGNIARAAAGPAVWG